LEAAQKDPELMAALQSAAQEAAEEQHAKDQTTKLDSMVGGDQAVAQPQVQMP
jgi:hypothetical protein